MYRYTPKPHYSNIYWPNSHQKCNNCVIISSNSVIPTKLLEWGAMMLVSSPKDFLLSLSPNKSKFTTLSPSLYRIQTTLPIKIFMLPLCPLSRNSPQKLQETIIKTHRTLWSKQKLSLWRSMITNQHPVSKREHSQWPN